MLPAQFYRLCAEHDWTYEFSDDGSVWRRGLSQRRVLVAAYTADPSLLPIFNSWVTYINAPSDAPRPQAVK
jgi:hypothetical protein